MASLPETGNSAINAAQASVALSADSKPGDAYHRLNPLSRWLEPTLWISDLIQHITVAHVSAGAAFKRWIEFC